MSAEPWDDYAYTALIVFCFLFRKNAEGNEEILLIRRANDPYKGETTVPGGRKRRGESLREACVREMGEETGYVLDPEKLTFAGILHAWRDGDAMEYVSHYFVCREFEGSLRGSDEGDLLWCGVAESKLLTGIHPFYVYLLPRVCEGVPFDAAVRISSDGKYGYYPNVDDVNGERST